MTYKANIGELIGFVARFLPPNQAQAEFEQLYAARNQPLLLDAQITESDREFSERLIASSVGNAHLDSVGKLVDAFVMHGALDIRDVMRIVDGARVFFEFMQELVQSSIQHISQGISVVDQNMRMVAWNKKYIEFFEYPEGYVSVGRPVADLIRFNIEKTGCHPSLVDSEVAKRVDYLRSGTPHNFERYRPGGKVLEVHGNPMPGAGFVTSYTDITPHKELESQLRRANETLELRVQERTHELEEAKLEAEQANFSKTQFLAAASHDLMQPLNAAGLFTSALQQKVDDADALELITNITLSLKASHDLLNSLLEASRLDSGAIRPKVTVFSVDDLLSELDREFTVLAKEEGLTFRKITSRILVRSDRQLLRRILQNFLSNAVRYTQHGKILLGCRHVGDDCRIEVWDTGCGIPENKWREIFQEFRRLDNTSAASPQEGLGLGLAIAERISHLLGHEISMRSWSGKGSVFSVSLPMASGSEQSLLISDPVTPSAGSLSGVRVMCVENDYFVLEGMKALLGGWGCDVSIARGMNDALMVASLQKPDIVLADYQLDDGVNGIDVLNALRTTYGASFSAIVITANNTEIMRNAAESAGYLFMPKPVKPASLRAAISGLLNRSLL